MSIGGKGTPVVTPALATPPSKEAIGAMAPSDPPASSLDAATIDRLIKERVEAEVSARLAELDPTKESVRPFEDQQFNNFDKKLEIFGVDLSSALPGYSARWVNDDRDRIPRMQIMGWTFVKRTEIALNEKLTPLNQDMGDNIAVYVGGDEQGKAMRSFLMKIPTPEFDKLMARNSSKDDAIEDAIQRGGIGPALSQGGYAGTDGKQVNIRYNPRQRANPS